MRYSNTTLSMRIRGILQYHGEKIACGAIGLLMIVLVWYSSLQSSYSLTTPGKMSSMADEAKLVITQPDSWEKLRPFRQANTQAAEKIANQPDFDGSVYGYRHLLGSTIAMLPLRNDPQLMAPEDLRVRHIRASVASLKKQRSDSIKSRLDQLPLSETTLPLQQRYESFFYRPKWASQIGDVQVVDAVAGTAVLRFSEQLAEYEDVFGFARNYDPVRDRPRYALLDVQRRNREDQQWQSITAHIYSVTDDLANKAIDPADTRFRLRNISLNIPPFLGINYLPLSIHPQIPVVDLSDKFKKDAPEVEADESTEPESELPPQLRLVRFYDMEPKQPGGLYQYRVRAWLIDPNDPRQVQVSSQATATGPTIARGNVQADSSAPPDDEDVEDDSNPEGRDPNPLFFQDLSSEVRKRQSQTSDDIPAFPESKRHFADLIRHAIATPWSEPSEWIGVAHVPNEICLGSVRTPAGKETGANLEEPTANVGVSVFVDELGTSVRGQTVVHRGTVINFSAPGKLLHIADLTVREKDNGVDESGDPIGHPFETGVVVVDMMGGERLPTDRGSDRLNTPGDMLVMDAQGIFQVHNDLDDQMAYRHTIFAGK